LTKSASQIASSASLKLAAWAEPDADMARVVPCGACEGRRRYWCGSKPVYVVTGSCPLFSGILQSTSDMCIEVLLLVGKKNKIKTMNVSSRSE
jgi:hypothetical protein